MTVPGTSPLFLFFFFLVIWVWGLGGEVVGGAAGVVQGREHRVRLDLDGVDGGFGGFQ